MPCSSHATQRAGQGDTNFLAWLSETVASAVQTAEAHEVLKQAIRAELAAVESRFDLAAVQACASCVHCIEQGFQGPNPQPHCYSGTWFDLFCRASSARLCADSGCCAA